MELRKAKNEGQLDKALNTYKKFQLLTIDELGYLPIDPEGARLLFQVISNTYETSSLIITTNVPFSKWVTIFGDDNIAAAIIDRLIHHGRLLRHQGKSRRVTRPHAITTGRKKPCNMAGLNLTEHNRPKTCGRKRSMTRNTGSEDRALSRATPDPEKNGDSQDGGATSRNIAAR